MPKFLVKEQSYINNTLVEAGTVIDYDPPEGTTISSNLQHVKKAAGSSAPPVTPEGNSGNAA